MRFGYRAFAISGSLMLLVGGLMLAFVDADTSRLQILASMLIIGMGLGFAGLGLLPLPEVTALGYAAPLLVVVFGARFVGEAVRKVRILAVALGLLGVLVVLSPRLSVAHGVQLQPNEVALMAERGVQLVSNPSANLRLRSGIAPVAAARPSRAACRSRSRSPPGSPRTRNQ